MTLRASIAHDLAEAAIKIATANHYLVGFAQEVDAISWDNFHDAYQDLIDRELKKGESPVLDLAMAVLNDTCFRVHRTHLS